MRYLVDEVQDYVMLSWIHNAYFINHGLLAHISSRDFSHEILWKSKAALSQLFRHFYLATPICRRYLTVFISLIILQ